MAEDLGNNLTFRTQVNHDALYPRKRFLFEYLETEEFTKHILSDVLGKVIDKTAEAIANDFVKNHGDEIVESIDVDEISRLITLKVKKDVLKDLLKNLEDE